MMSIENIPSYILKMMCCASNVNITTCLIVCVTVTKNIPVNTRTHAFHSEGNQKEKGPEVLHSEDISQLVFNGKKTPEKKEEKECSSEMLLSISQTASCHIPKHCTLNVAICISNCKLSHPKTLHTKCCYLYPKLQAFTSQNTAH